jgi:FAD/FMN-containing dehydrogenase
VISTNAGGINVLRYGNTRNLVLGLEVVLADGEVWDGLRALRKDNAGYDLKQLFIGAEGTLGIVTRAVLRLVPRPRSSVSVLVAVPDPVTATRLLRRAQGDFSETLTSFELLEAPCVTMTLDHLGGGDTMVPGVSPWYVLIEVSGPADQASCENTVQRFLEAAFPDEVSDARLAISPAQADALWTMRESIPDAHNRAGFSVKHDISVPVSRVAEFLRQADAALHSAYPQVQSFTFGHLGDGNLHYNPLIKLDGHDPIDTRREVNRIVHDIVFSLGGSVSAEHGVGQVRLGDVERYRSAVELRLMRRVKEALDPEYLMNPGKILHEEAS